MENEPVATATARASTPEPHAISAGVSPIRNNMPPVPRTGHVDEIASAALFLAQPEQGYLTGQIIHVNGGAYLGT